MKKTKERLELLIVMQKHKISELTEFKGKAERAGLWLFFIARIAKAKMKLNHYKQLLAQCSTVKKSCHAQLKVGDKVKITEGGTSWNGWVDSMDKYIGQVGTVEVVGRYTGNCKVRTKLDKKGTTVNALWWFPPEALELVP